MGKYVDNFNEIGWTQGDLARIDEKWNPEIEDYDVWFTGVCAMGNLLLVEGYLDKFGRMVGITNTASKQLSSAVALTQAIKEEYPEFYASMELEYEGTPPTDYVITSWNDNGDRTDSEVRDMLKRMEEILAEQFSE